MADTTTIRMMTYVVFTLIISAFTTGLPITERSDVSDWNGDSSHRDDPGMVNGEMFDGVPTLPNGELPEGMIEEELAKSNLELAMANAGPLSGNPAFAKAGLFNGNPEMASAGPLSGNPAMANAGLMSGNPAMANGGLLSGNPAMANAGLLSGNPAMANGGLLSGNPAMANSRLMSGNPAMANAGIMSGNPAMANAGLLSGNPAMANAGLLSGNPAMANSRLMSGNPAMANVGIMSGNPAMANGDLLSGNPAMANSGLMSGNPAMANAGLISGNPALANAGRFNLNPEMPPQHLGPMMNMPEDQDPQDQFMIEGPDDYQQLMDVFDIRAMRGQCPMVDCMMVHMMLACPDSEREPAMFTMNGMLCKGCLRCKDKSGEQTDTENILPDLHRESLSLIGGRNTETARDPNVASVTPEEGGSREGHPEKVDVSENGSRPETDDDRDRAEIGDDRAESSRDPDSERSKSRDVEIPELVVGGGGGGDDEGEPEAKESSKSAAVTSSVSDSERTSVHLPTTDASIERVLK